MAVIILALVSGLVFGSGLTIAGMSEPAKVLGFLDIFGTWDPTLAVVMVAALIIVIPGYVLARRHGRPILAKENLWPAKILSTPPSASGRSCSASAGAWLAFAQDLPSPICRRPRRASSFL